MKNSILKPFLLTALVASPCLLPASLGLLPATVLAAESAAPATSPVAAVGTTQIARWKDNKSGCFVLMFDDGWPSHWQVAMPELVKRHMTATFYIPPAKGEFKQFIKVWKEQMLPAGMVLGNHTMTHDGFQGADDTVMEYTASTDFLLDFAPGKKPRLISFALPGVKDYNYGGTDTKALMVKNNLIDRGTFAGHGAVYHFQKTEQMLALADKAIAEKNMNYLVIHGVERITPDWHYQDFWALKQTIFTELLDGLAERRDRGDLWITDHISAYKYDQEFKTAQVKVVAATAKQIALDLTSEADATLYDQPLSLSTRVPATWVKCSVVQGETRTEATAANGSLSFEALPNAGQVTIAPLK